MAKSKRKTKPPKKKSAPRKARAKTKTAKRLHKTTAIKSPAKPELTTKLYNAALTVLNDRQAEDIVTIDLKNRNSVADYLVIASGRAARQIVAIANYLREDFEKLGVRPIRVEGLPQANWVLVDAGDVVVHLFRPEVRDYYRLEDIWNRTT